MTYAKVSRGFLCCYIYNKVYRKSEGATPMTGVTPSILNMYNPITLLFRSRQRGRLRGPLL